MLLTSLRGGGIPRNKLRYVSVPLLLVGAAFAIVSLISGLEGELIYNIDVSIGALLSGTVQYAFIMIFFPLMAGYYLSVDKLNSMMRFISLGYLLPMFLTLILISQGAPESLREAFFFSGRALGTYGNAVSFAGVLMIVLPYYTILYVTEKRFWKLIGFVGVNLTIVCLVLTISFSGVLIFLSLVIGNMLLALVWHDHPICKYKSEFAYLAIITALVITTVGGIAAISSPEIKKNMTNRIFFLNEANTKNVELENFGSADQRLYLIDTALNLINDREGGLLWGHGMRQTESLPAFSFYGPHLDVHLLYLLLWIEGGFILALLYIIFLLLLIRNVMKLAKISPSGAVAVGSAVIAIALFGMLNPHLYLRYFWIPILPAFVNWNAHLRDYNLGREKCISKHGDINNVA